MMDTVESHLLDTHRDVLKALNLGVSVSVHGGGGGGDGGDGFLQGLELMHQLFKERHKNCQLVDTSRRLKSLNNLKEEPTDDLGIGRRQLRSGRSGCIIGCIQSGLRRPKGFLQLA
jgi:hypothetical protein